jgi:hypothetical protein
MTIYLSTLTFTNKDDLVPLMGMEDIVNTGIANTLAGNDKITGTGDFSGIILKGRDTAINTGNGNDKISGSGGVFGITIGISDIQNTGGTITTGNGNDEIAGQSDNFYGISLSGGGIITTDNGNDGISGMSCGDNGIFLSDNSTIDTGTGNDIIFAKGITNGLANEGGTIITRNGNDKIVGISVGVNTDNLQNGIRNQNSTIDTGSGNDIIRGTSIGENLEYNFNTEGISNENGTILTGVGNDMVIGISSYDNGISNAFASLIDTGNGNDKVVGEGANYGIFNDNSIINTGAGNDTIDALHGGFGGNGITILGSGNDIVKGFGTGQFDGGAGKDLLLLSAGQYSVSKGSTLNSFYTVSSGGIDMFVKSFESIGDADNPGMNFSFSSVIGGSFTIPNV